VALNVQVFCNKGCTLVSSETKQYLLNFKHRQTIQGLNVAGQMTSSVTMVWKL